MPEDKRFYVTRTQHGGLKHLSRPNHQELLNLANEYKQRSYRDPRTGLLNIEGAHELFNAEKRVLERTGVEFGQYSAIVVDLVGLKATNRDEGFVEGSKKIKTLADHLRKDIREEMDLVVRLGGDEFALVGINADRDVRRTILNRILNDLPKNIKINVATATFEPGDDIIESLDMLTNKLEDAKKLGPKDETGRSLGIGYTLEVN